MKPLLWCKYDRNNIFLQNLLSLGNIRALVHRLYCGDAPQIPSKETINDRGEGVYGIGTRNTSVISSEVMSDVIGCEK